LAIDVAVTHPLINKYVNSANPADEYAVNVKMRKYGDSFIGSRKTFLPMVFETFGGISTRGMAVLKDIFRMSADRSMDARSVVVAMCWRRVSMILQLGNAEIIWSRCMACGEEEAGD